MKQLLKVTLALVLATQCVSAYRPAKPFAVLPFPDLYGTITCTSYAQDPAYLVGKVAKLQAVAANYTATATEVSSFLSLLYGAEQPSPSEYALNLPLTRIFSSINSFASPFSSMASMATSNNDAVLANRGLGVVRILNDAFWSLVVIVRSVVSRFHEFEDEFYVRMAPSFTKIQDLFEQLTQALQSSMFLQTSTIYDAYEVYDTENFLIETSSNLITAVNEAQQNSWGTLAKYELSNSAYFGQPDDLCKVGAIKNATALVDSMNASLSAMHAVFDPSFNDPNASELKKVFVTNLKVIARSVDRTVWALNETAYLAAKSNNSKFAYEAAYIGYGLKDAIFGTLQVITSVSEVDDVLTDIEYDTLNHQYFEYYSLMVENLADVTIRALLYFFEPALDRFQYISDPISMASYSLAGYASMINAALPGYIEQIKTRQQMPGP